MGSPQGAIKAAATRIGISEIEYREHLARGLKWCRGCKKWHPRDAFGIDITRGDGLASTCIIKRSADQKAAYIPKPGPEPGRRFVDFRNGDKRQARRRVNYLVEAGLLPRPDTIPCCDCTHMGDDRRHEYDHHLGYAAAHHEHVEVVCSKCHHKRSIERVVGQFE